MTIVLSDKRQDALAFDRASTRSKDSDGHLHVVRCAISKANVCPYWGREIPDYQDLGLDANKSYSLLRDPDELAKAADSFNGKPLLFDHNPVSADEHDHDRTVGAVSNPEFSAPYLYADLSCWSGPAISLIEDGSQKELSSAYRYTADMTPGTYEGVRYDGVMRGISANHVALVKKGRAGPDVVVGDSASQKEIIMAKTALSGAAAQTQGALYAYLRPKLAQDKRIDLGPIVSPLTAKNFKSSIPAIVLEVQKASRGKLAQDADLNDLPEMVEALVDAIPPDVAAEVEAKIDDENVDAADDDKELRDKLEAAGVPADVIDKVIAAMADNTPDAEDEKDEDDKDKKKPAMDAKALAKAVSAALKGTVTKHAMDAAIKTATEKAARDAVAQTTERLNSVEEARRFVRPWVGEIAMSFDSAEGVHRQALTMLNKAHAGKHADALTDIIEACPKPGESKPTRTPRVAQDAAATKSRDEFFGTSRIGVAA